MNMYEIVHAIPGRLRLRVPSLMRIPVSRLKKISLMDIPEGIEDVRVNIFNASVVIKYNPKKIDPLEYIEKIISEPEFRNLLT